MRLFINGLAASAGGGLTYLRNMIPHLARRTDVEAAVLLNPQVRSEFGELPNISFVEATAARGALRRLRFEQMALPHLVQSHGAQVLVSTGNFALWNSPVPQIVLSRNALYTSGDFLRDVRARRDYAMWADTLIKGWFARRSVRRAEVTVAPSEAFAQELRQWAGKKVVCVHHGFDQQAFVADPTPLSERVQQPLDDANDALRLLFVSHYNYYRNFETLFRALPLLSDRLDGKKVKLFLTCRLNSAENPGSYRAEAASALASSLRASGSVVELGTVPYRSLHHLYRACHIYVTPAYAESFAHPLVESMSSGLPVVASDLPVHREICQDAATYFPRFSPEALAEQVLQVCRSPELAEQLTRRGLSRAQDFRWDTHVQCLLSLAQELVDVTPKRA
jgi:glycosyltransferase involved in cell wall biosynthesis